MTHVYRPKESQHGLLVRLGLAAVQLVFFAAAIVGTVIWVAWAWHQGPGQVLFAVGIPLLFWGSGYRNHHYRSCQEIRLSDDGRCELHAKRQVVRLYVSRIKSVRDGTGDEDVSYHYLIRYAGGKMNLYGDWPDFDDFVARLETLNPYVDLRGYRPSLARGRDEATRLHKTLEWAKSGRGDGWPCSRAEELSEMLEIARREARRG